MKTYEKRTVIERGRLVQREPNFQTRIEPEKLDGLFYEDLWMMVPHEAVHNMKPPLCRFEIIVRATPLEDT